MKISIMDLMGHYYGDPIKINTPQSAAVGGTAAPTDPAPQPKGHRFRQPLLIAASLILVVTAAAAVPFTLSRTVGSRTMAEAGVSVESVLDELPPELPSQLPAALPESSLESALETEAEGSPAPSEAPADTSAITPVILSEQITAYANAYCYGNLLYTDSGYYTMGDTGPEPVETTNLNTTVSLRGDWNVNIDYAVIDGALCFLDWNSVGAAEPGRAVAYPVAGSPDTLMLMVSRNGVDIFNNEQSFDYKFLYNVLTGEITDPLANVPELDSHGTVSQVLFNSDFSRAIVSVEPEIRRLPEELRTVTVGKEHHSYLCDLSTGEMTAVADLAAPLIEGLGLSADEFAELGMCFFSDNDNILLYDIRSFLNPYGDLDLRYWLFSCNVETGALNYSIENVRMTPSTALTFDYNFPYVHFWNYVLDSQTGAEYELPMSTEQLFFMPAHVQAGRRTAIFTTGGGFHDTDVEEIYLLEGSQLCTIGLGDEPEFAENVFFVTENWLCITDKSSVYCYHIPDDLPMTPLTAN